MKASIVIPAYNEEKAIENTLNTLIPYARKNDWQIIVIDDGSTDNTLELIRKFDEIVCINHKKNKGYGAALKTGIINSKSDIIVTYDADGQHNPEDIKKLLSNFGDKDMLVGKRGADSHKEWIRKPGKWLLTFVANILTDEKIPDLNSGLRVIRKKIIVKLFPLLSDTFSFSTTSTISMINMGYKVEYYPIKTNKRIGKSTVKQMKHGSETILLILRLITTFNPLKIFLPISLYMFIIGLLYEIVYGIILIPGVKLISAAFLFIISSILIFLFGLIADQISSIRKSMIIK